jgi:hypothetical protein
MNRDVSPKQALFLWKMITAETPEHREPKAGSATPKLDPKKERQPLIDKGYLDTERRGLATHLVLTDKAWAWAAGNVDVDLMKSNSKVGAEALQGLLRRLLPYLQRNDLQLSSLFADPPVNVKGEHASTTSSPPVAPEKRPAPETDVQLAQSVERACLQLTGGQRQQRVRLTRLREVLSQVPRHALDATLLALQDAGRAVLYRDDNTSGLTEADHEAALYVGDAPRHLVYLEA